MERIQYFLFLTYCASLTALLYYTFVPRVFCFALSFLTIFGFFATVNGFNELETSPEFHFLVLFSFWIPAAGSTEVGQSPSLSEWGPGVRINPSKISLMDLARSTGVDLFTSLNGVSLSNLLKCSHFKAAFPSMLFTNLTVDKFMCIST